MSKCTYLIKWRPITRGPVYLQQVSGDRSRSGTIRLVRDKLSPTAGNYLYYTWGYSYLVQRYERYQLYNFECLVDAVVAYGIDVLYCFFLLMSRVRLPGRTKCLYNLKIFLFIIYLCIFIICLISIHTYSNYKK